MGASSLDFGISRLNRDTRRVLVPYLIAGVAVVAVINSVIQMQGLWNNLCMEIVLLEISS